MYIDMQFRTHFYESYNEYVVYFGLPGNVDHALFARSDKELYKYSMLDEFSTIDVRYGLQDLTTCTEEELFQLSCVWDYPVSMEFMMQVQDYLKKCISSGVNYSDKRIIILEDVDYDTK